MARFVPAAPVAGFRNVALAIACLSSISLLAQGTDPGPTIRWWPDRIEERLTASGTNRVQLRQALQQVPPQQRDGMQFLIEHMPEPDLKSLSASYLLENTALAYDAFDRAAWRDQIAPELFLNEILPYACVNETREAWRAKLREISAPLVADCRTPGEAAQRLNQKLFGLVKVKYSTQRRKADQSPSESMESGLASCTGLSILLIDACRSVGVPARLVGTPLWANKRGNHTWVEVWDGGWHYAGAAEPDPHGLDRGWFGHDAAQALKDVPEHAIYASSFRKTDVRFPLVWARGVDYVSAVNVTERYAKSAAVPEDSPMLLVKVLDQPGGKRVAATVRVIDPADRSVKFKGTSKDESVDLNDLLSFRISKDRPYQVVVEKGERTIRHEVPGTTNKEALLIVCLQPGPVSQAFPQPSYLPPKVRKELKQSQAKKLRAAAIAYFTAPAEERAKWKFAGDLERLLRQNEPAVRRTLWEAYRAAPIHAATRENFDTNRVRFDRHESPYTVRQVGERPAPGWPLVIAMHGGGGAPREVNDSQWKIMQRYYRDHPEAGGYLYLALRAPNDTWNGFYTDYVYPLVENLINQFLLFGEVDPNRIFLIGYSHGGYGAFAIGPKMPDRFAAIHASAAAPTDGETTARTLRHTPFTFMIGETDTAYGRMDRCRKFDETVTGLRGERRDIYPVTMELKTGFGHRGLPDKDKIAEMYPAVRNPVPADLTWLMTDSVIEDFYWLRATGPSRKQEIEAACRNNRVVVTVSPGLTAASVLVDSRLIDFKRPVTLVVNGRTSTQKLRPSLRTFCESLARRGDPELASTAEMILPLERKTASR